MPVFHFKKRHKDFNSITLRMRMKFATDLEWVRDKEETPLPLSVDVEDRFCHESSDEEGAESGGVVLAADWVVGVAKGGA